MMRTFDMPRIKRLEGLCNQMNFLQQLDLLKIDNACRKPLRIFVIFYIDSNANIESLFKEEDTTSHETIFVISCNKEIQMMFVVALSSLDIFATCPTYLAKI